MDNNPKLWIDCFYLEENRYEYQFMWHKCDCGLPTIICRAATLLEHSYLLPQLEDCYIIEEVIRRKHQV